MPPGKTLDKALQASVLGQAGAAPFHVKLEVTQTKGDRGKFESSVEETWASPTRWTRTVRADGLTQTLVMNDTGLHFVTEGDYFPMWLRSFVTGLFTPVPNVDEWNKSNAPLEHIEMANGVKSNPCQHSEFNLGEAPVQQINFANVCFREDGLLDFTGRPGYGMEFHDYKGFGHLKVARTLIDHPNHGVELVGKVVVLESVPSPAATMFETPASASSADPLRSVHVSTGQLSRMAGGRIAFKWPNPIPGRGMFTVWVCVDRDGKVREVHPLNSDESGFASDMASQLEGQTWKGAVMGGAPVQVEGAIVVSYPPASDVAAHPASGS